MEYFLQIFGDQTIGWGVAIIGSASFLVACYKKLETYIANKTYLEKEKDKKIEKVIKQSEKYPIWHQQSIDIREELNNSISEINQKIDSLSTSMNNLDKKISENEASTYRYRILRFNDEICHDEKHTKEHFDQIIEDVNKYETYCHEHPSYENNKAIFAIENVKNTYRESIEKNLFL